MCHNYFMGSVTCLHVSTFTGFDQMGAPCTHSDTLRLCAGSVLFLSQSH